MRYAAPACLMFALLLATPACSLFSGEKAEEMLPSGPPETLDEARRLWRARTGGSYSYRLERVCFCGPARLSARVRVEEGEVVDVGELRSEGEPWDEAQSSSTDVFVPVEELFELVARAEAGEIHAARPTYDAELGYPTALHVDFESGIADDEISYYARDIEP